MNKIAKQKQQKYKKIRRKQKSHRTKNNNKQRHKEIALI